MIAARRLGFRLLIGLAATAAAASLRLALEPVLRDEAAFTPNFLAVFVAAYFGGWPAGATTLGLSGLVTYVFFMDPPGLLVRRVGDAVSVGLFWVIGGLILASVVGLRGSLSRLAEREKALLLAQQQERMLSREMGHRVKNLLSVVTAVVEQSIRSSAGLADARERIAMRLRSLGTAQELALNPLEEVSLARVVRAAVEAIGDDRIGLQLWADGQMETDGARGLVLALHELATNALKYGALSRPDGGVRLTTELGEDGAVRVEWREQGGPEVKAPKARGFGSRLITHALPSPGDEVRLTFPAQGVVCVFRLRVDEPRANPTGLAGLED